MYVNTYMFLKNINYFRIFHRNKYFKILSVISQSYLWTFAITLLLIVLHPFVSDLLINICVHISHMTY